MLDNHGKFPLFHQRAEKWVPGNRRKLGPENLQNDFFKVIQWRENYSFARFSSIKEKNMGPFDVLIITSFAYCSKRLFGLSWGTFTNYSNSFGVTQKWRLKYGCFCSLVTRQITFFFLNTHILWSQTIFQKQFLQCRSRGNRNALVKYGQNRFWRGWSRLKDNSKLYYIFFGRR